MALYQCVLRLFQSICLNYCACHEKVMPGHTKCCTCHAKSSQQTSRSDAPKCNPSQKINARAWWTCLLYCACHGKCIFADPLQMSHACHRFWKCYKTLTSFSLLTRCTIPCAWHAKRHFKVQEWREHVMLLSFWLRNLLRATTACTFSTSQLPKVVRAWCALYFLTSKCASRHNSVHFFNSSTSKSAPKLRCFVHFDFEVCFAPQRRALFRHLIRPDGSAPAALASLLFDPPEPQIIGKTHCFAAPYLFAFIFFLLRFSLLWSSLFYSSLLSDSSCLCFSSVHTVGSLTSKLPSVMCWLIIAYWIMVIVYHVFM